MWKVQVEVMPKKGILDPEGSTIQDALLSLGYRGVWDMHIGKKMDFLLEGFSKEEAKRQVEEMCKKLLANPVIEDYSFSIQRKDD